jgi:hypothetical protein
VQRVKIQEVRGQMLAHKVAIPTDILWFSSAFLSKCCKNTLKMLHSLPHLSQFLIHSNPTTQHYKSHAAPKLALNNARINQPLNFGEK